MENTKTKYRYRDKSGATSTSLKRVERHLTKLGKIQYIRGYVYVGAKGIKHSAVLVRGENGTARFSGFAWGYGGTGPRGLVDVLKKLNVSDAEIARVMQVPWQGWTTAKEFWKIVLPS